MERKPTITGTVIIKKSLFIIFIGYDTSNDTTLPVSGVSPYVCDLSGIRSLLIHTQY